MLILVRHGQTVANAEARLVGRLDAPLTELGERQAAAMASVLAAAGPIARVVSSSLQRARHTAAALGLPVEVDDRWIELDYGRYDGLRLPEVPAELWERWRSDPGFLPPGGESLAAVGVRVREACEELVTEMAGDHVVVVSHVSPIKAAVAWALGVGDGTAWRMHLDTASICRLAIGPAGPSLRTFNESAHLADLVPAP